MKLIVTAAAGLRLILGAYANTFTYSKNARSNNALHDDLIARKTVMARQVSDTARDAMDRCMADKAYERKVDK